jgi:hypothetical protein
LCRIHSIERKIPDAQPTQEILSLKSSTLYMSLGVLALTTALCVAAQAPPAPRPVPAAATPQTHDHEHPKPTNLKVLPKDWTGDQVHEIMHQWEADLGVTCKTCHVENPNDIAPNGRPRLNYAADSKQEKESARVMYKMLDDINANYVANIENSGLPVTCGTCHQGHLNPEQFDPEERHRTALATQATAAKPAGSQ